MFGFNVWFGVADEESDVETNEIDCNLTNAQIQRQHFKGSHPMLSNHFFVKSFENCFIYRFLICDTFATFL